MKAHPTKHHGSWVQRHTCYDNDGKGRWGSNYYFSGPAPLIAAVALPLVVETAQVLLLVPARQG